MKTKSFLTIVFLCLGWATSYAQDPSEIVSPRKNYQVWLQLKNDLGLNNGMIQGTSPTELIVRARRGHQIDTFHYANLQLVETRPNNKPLWGALIGSGIGLAAGLGIGYALGNASTDDSDEGVNAILGTVARGVIIVGVSSLGMTSGGVIGALVGSKKKQFIIDGKKENFTIFRLALNPSQKP